MNQLTNSMKEEMIFIPAETFVHSSCTLARKIPAILLESQPGQGNGKAKLGPILHLPVGSQVQ
ncbi:MAG: hypothetical protein JOZ45_00425, partial [Acidobacteriaceae bacterium]|nr:hypothetical protein [Acidobacteriaceae bacterium]